MYTYLQKYTALLLIGIFLSTQSIPFVSGYTGTGIEIAGLINQYTVIDSTENSGPIYDWVDISNTGANLRLDSNVLSLYESTEKNIINLDGFMPFAGDTIHSCYISPTDGKLILSGIDTTPHIINLHTPWNNINDTFQSGKVYVFSDISKNRTIIQFKDMVLSQSAGVHNFEAILQKNGRIILQYQTPLTERKISIGDLQGNSELHYGNASIPTDIFANTAIHFYPNSHNVDLELPSEMSDILRKDIVLTGTGTNVANEPVTLLWSIVSTPEGSLLTHENLGLRTSSQLTFQADVPGSYVFSLRGTNALPEYSHISHEKTITVHAYGMAFFSDSTRRTPVTISTIQNEIYGSLTGLNYLYNKNITATLTTEVSKDSEEITLMSNSLKNQYEFGPISVTHTQSGAIQNGQLEIGNNEQIMINFSPTQRIKNDFQSTHTGSTYTPFAGETSVSYINMNTPNDLKVYQTLLGNIGSKLLIGSIGDNSHIDKIGLFGTNPIGDRVESSLTFSGSSFINPATRALYTQDNLNYYAYQNYRSDTPMYSQYMNVIHASGEVVGNTLLAIPPEIPKIQSFVLTGPNNGILYMQEGYPLKRFTIENNTLILGSDITYSTLTSSQSQYYGLNRMLAVNTSGKLLLITIRNLSYSHAQLTVHSIDATTGTIFTEADKTIEHMIMNENFITDYVPLQTLTTQKQDTFWIHQGTQSILEVNTQTQTVTSYENPNQIESIAIDTVQQKILTISQVQSQNGTSDLNVCSSILGQNLWDCHYVSSFLALNDGTSKLPKPKSYYGQSYVDASQTLFMSTDIGMITYSLNNATFALGSELQDTPDYTSLDTTFSSTETLVNNVSEDDNKYQITEPVPVCEGCLDWIGWNQQVYTLPITYELKNDDTLEVLWKGYNTATPQDAGKNDIYLEIYNHMNDTWDLGDFKQDNTLTTDFELKTIYTKETIGPYLNNNEVTYRVREYEWTVEQQGGFSLHTNYVSLAQNISTVPTTIGYNPLAGAVVPLGNINTPPILNPINNQTLTLGGSLSLTAIATDSDTPANILTYTLTGSSPLGATIHPLSGQFNWTPSATGSFTVQVTVTDNGAPNLTTTGSFNITVNPLPIIPGAPIITPTIGGGLSQDVCPNGDTSPSTYDGICSLGNGTPQIVTAMDLEFSSIQGSPVNDILVGKTNYTGAIITYTGNNSSTGGELIVNPTGDFQFRPYSDFIGDFRFTYRAKSNEIWSNTGTIVIHVTPLILPSAPVDTNGMPTERKGCKYQDMDFSKLQFKDISKNARKNNIELLLKNCIVNGRTTKAYQPTDFATRAEFTKVVLRSTGIQYDFSGRKSYFRDIPTNDWRAGVTEEALQLQIIRGIHREDGVYFEGDRAITKKEALLILARSLRLEEGQTKKISQSYREYQDVLREYGVREYLISDEQLTRDEMAKIVSTIFRKRYPLELQAEQA